jgi:hypothetical protein
MCESIAAYYIWSRGGFRKPGQTISDVGREIFNSSLSGEIFQIFDWYEAFMKYDSDEMFERYNGVGYDCN